MIYDFDIEGLIEEDANLRVFKKRLDDLKHLGTVNGEDIILLM